MPPNTQHCSPTWESALSTCFLSKPVAATVHRPSIFLVGVRFSLRPLSRPFPRHLPGNPSPRSRLGLRSPRLSRQAHAVPNQRRRRAGPRPLHTRLGLVQLRRLRHQPIIWRALRRVSRVFLPRRDLQQARLPHGRRLSVGSELDFESVRVDVRAARVLDERNALSAAGRSELRAGRGRRQRSRHQFSPRNGQSRMDAARRRRERVRPGRYLANQGQHRAYLARRTRFHRAEQSRERRTFGLHRFAEANPRTRARSIHRGLRRLLRPARARSQHSRDHPRFHGFYD